MSDLQRPRHTSTLPNPADWPQHSEGPVLVTNPTTDGNSSHRGHPLHTDAFAPITIAYPIQRGRSGSVDEAAGRRTASARPASILGCPGAFRCSWHAVLALKVRTARHQIRQNGFVTSWSASAGVSPISRSIRSLNEASTARLILRRRHSRSALRTSLGARSSTRRRPAERPMEIARHPNDARRA